MRRCLDGALGNSEEVAGLSGEEATYCVKGIGYPLIRFKNDVILQCFAVCFFHLNFLRHCGASPQSE